MFRRNDIFPVIAVCVVPIFFGTLSGCSLFDDSDPREGAETPEACIARLAGESLDETFAPNGELVVPTYTYDITKVGLEDLQELTVPGSDETAGSRGMAATNETSTAVTQFMAQSVDEKGAFFMGRDPALYRVRGEPVALDQVVSAGCERQRTGMRLISFTANPTSTAPGSEDPNETSPLTESDT